MSDTTEDCKSRGRVAYRRVEKPVPVILPACRNCTHYLCDHDDRLNAKGELTFSIFNSRCGLHKFTVMRNCVCASHAYHHSSRRDK